MFKTIMMILMMMAFAAPAQAGSLSYDETMEWIKGKVLDVRVPSKLASDAYRTITHFSYDRYGSMSWTLYYVGYNDDGTIAYEKTRQHKGSVSHCSVHSGISADTVWTSDDKLLVSSRALGKRICKAMEHAASLVSEPF